MMRVFVSSVYRGLENVRNLLLGDIRQAGDDAVGMEDFGARVKAPLEVSVEEVRTPDVVVLIVGPRYGSVDESTGLSITHLEFREAQEYGIHVLAFVLPADPSLSREEASALQAFRDEVAIAALTYKALGEPNGLPGAAMAALKRFDVERGSLPGQFGPFQCGADFFAALLNPKAPFNHSHELVGRREVLDQLDAFVNGEGFVAILPGPGGVGKSRLLREFAANSESCVFLGTHFELKPEHLTQLPRRAQCLVVDDAHRLPSIESLIQLAYTWFQKRELGLKLVLTCRPSGLDRLRAAVRFVGEGVLELPELPPLNKATHAFELAVAVVGDDKPDLAKALVRATDGVPLLITVGGRLLVRDEDPATMLAQKAVFQSAALNSLLSELPSTIDGVSIRRLLAILAAIGPVRPGQEPSVFTMLAEYLKKPRSSVVSATATLRKQHGLLIERGTRLRVSPDVLGDYLLNEAAVADDGSSTRFIDEVFDFFGQRFLSNILSNASELEWRFRSAGSPVSVSERIWERIHEDLPSLTHRERVGLLKAVEASAWVAPKAVWKIVSWMLENPVAPHDVLDQIVSSAYSQEDIVRQVPGIIRTLAWHSELSRSCAHVLWDISVEDDRALNAAPDHPLRVLGELLSFDPRKPPLIQERLLDGVEDAMLNDEKGGRPRDVTVVLSSLLSRTLGWSIRDGVNITMLSTALPARDAKVIEIRERAIGLVERQLSSSSASLAVKAGDTLLDLLRPPFGMYGREVVTEEVASWEEEVDGVVNILLRLVPDIDRPMVGYVARRGLENSVVARYWPTIGQRIEKLLGEMLDPDAFVLYDSLRPWAHLFRGNLDREASEKLHTERISQATNHLLKVCDSPAEIVEQMGHALVEMNAVDLNADPWRLLNSLCDLDPSSVPQLAMTILGGACRSLQKKAGLVYCRWFSQEPRTALDEIESRIEMDEEDIALGIADAYWQRWLGQPEVCTSRHVSNIAKLLKSKHWSVRKTVLNALVHARGSYERQALDVLIAADFGDDADLLDSALLLIDEKHGLSPQALTKVDIEALLHKLRYVRELSSDHFHTNQFLQLAAATRPAATVSMLLARIEYAASLPDESSERYQPLPYAHFVQGLDALAEGTEYANLLRRIRDRVLEEHYIYRFWIPQLFALASSSYGVTSMHVLREWAKSTDPEQVVFAVFLTKEAGPGFAFTHDDFVVECLTNAESLGEEVLQRVESNLHAGACSFSYSTSIGEAPKVMVQSKKQCEGMAEKHKAVPAAKAFYSRLAASFQRMIDENLAEDEELLDQ